MLGWLRDHAPWLAPIIVFGVVVFVHELGHFMAAKAVGVYAPRFSIGFGPALWRKRWGETEYVLAALPLGGYVRMASRQDEEIAFLEGGSEHAPAVGTVGANGAPASIEETTGTRPASKDWDPNAIVPFGPKPVPEHRWFESKPLVARLFILIAGVAMNTLLTLVVSVGVFAHYGRGYQPAVVDSVLPGRPAALAGLMAGDSIVAVADRPVRTWAEVVEGIGAAPGRTITVDVLRRGEARRIEVRPESTKAPNPATGIMEVVGRIGAAGQSKVIREPTTFPEAVSRGWQETWQMAGSVVVVLRGLATREVSVSTLGGPIAIAKTSVAAARNGIGTLLYLVALLSINVAVFNLLPIPILDGGQILINVLEAAKGSPFSLRTREYILRAGLLAIALLFMLVMFNDLGIGRLFG
jgi:regulator of sigma E protease